MPALPPSTSPAIPPLATISQSKFFLPGLIATTIPTAPSAFVAEEDGDWWAGVQKCAAAVVLAATLAISASQTVQARQVFSWQDEVIVPQPAVFTGDEDFWYPVAPVQASNLRLYLPDADEIPTGSLFGQADEDFWAPPLPQKLSLWSVAFTDDETVAPQPVVFGTDEDFWQPPLPWTYPSVRVISDDDVTVPQPAILGVDEDFWTPPLPWKTQTSVVFTDDDTIVPQPAVLGIDEDYWRWPVYVQNNWVGNSVLFMTGLFDYDSIIVPQPVVTPSQGRSTRFGFSFPSFR